MEVWDQVLANIVRPLGGFSPRTPQMASFTVSSYAKENKRAENKRALVSLPLLPHGAHSFSGPILMTSSKPNHPTPDTITLRARVNAGTWGPCHSAHSSVWLNRESHLNAYPSLSSGRFISAHPLRKQITSSIELYFKLHDLLMLEIFFLCF